MCVYKELKFMTIQTHNKIVNFLWFLPLIIIVLLLDIVYCPAPSSGGGGSGGGSINTSSTVIAEAFTNGIYVVNGVQYATNRFSVIQAAFDQMPTYSSKQKSGGGTLYLQVGIYDLTNTIVLTNNNIMSWAIEGQGNNSTVIKANGIYEVIHVGSSPTNDANLNLVMEHLAVVNSTNCQTNLVYISHESKDIFNDCIFSGWEAWTNNGFVGSLGQFGIQPGLAGGSPTYPPGLIGVYDQGSEGDRFLIQYCTFNALAVGFVNNSDHTELFHDDFSVISQWANSGLPTFGNSWPSSSIYSVGWSAASFGGIKPMEIWYAYYFDCNATCGGKVNERRSDTENGNQGPVIFANGTININGIVPSLVDDIFGANNGVTTATSNTVWSTSGAFLPGPNVVTGWLNNQFGTFSSDGNQTFIAGLDQNNGFFQGNGSELTSLNAGALSSGTVPTTALAAIPVGVRPRIPGAVTLTGSVFTFSNATPNYLECYLSGSVAYSVSKNGATVFQSLASDGYMLLQPTNKIAITYTVAPTLLTNAF